MNEEQQLYSDLVYVMFYGGVTLLALVAGAYLLFRRGNAIAPEITPPLRLRRWVAAFFVLMALGHVWWLLLTCFRVISDPWLAIVVGAGLDSMTLVPAMMAMLLVMLQDRRRPLWPFFVAVVPAVAILVISMIYRSDTFILLLKVYLFLLGIVFMIMMVLAVRQYGRWLRDNYADLEHKEVWQSLTFAVGLFVVYEVYTSNGGELLREYLSQIVTLVIIAFLLWRVETLQELKDEA